MPIRRAALSTRVPLSSRTMLILWVSRPSVDSKNAGLYHAIEFLVPVQAKHPWISFSDLWTLSGVEAIHAMGGPKIPWTPGRTDYVRASLARSFSLSIKRPLLQEVDCFHFVPLQTDEAAAHESRGDISNRLPDGAQGPSPHRPLRPRLSFAFLTLPLRLRRRPPP